MILTDDERKEIKNELIESIVEQWGSNEKFDCLDTALKSAMPMIVEALLFSDGKLTLDVTKLADAADAKAELVKYIRSFESLSACDFVNDELIKEAKANDKLYF